MSEQRTIDLSHWLGRHNTTDVTVWKLNKGVARHAELRDRLSIAINTGDANIALRPTAAEARELIAALQWALEVDETKTGEPA